MERIRTDAELQTIMAGLDIMDVDTEMPKLSPEQSTSEPRVLRKRKSIMPESTKSSNRRICMKPKKHTLSENANPKEIEAFYLDKKIKKNTQTLETIYEEPMTDKSNTETLMGGKKIKRLLTFHLGNNCTKEKIKKRRSKIKKLLGNRAFLNRKKIPMEVFLKTIEDLDLNENAQTKNSKV